MKHETLTRITLGLAMVAIFGVTAQGTSLWTMLKAAPIHSGQVCYRCQRVITESRLATEVIDTSGRIARPFKTVACVVKYLNESGDKGELLVTDFRTGRFLPAGDAMFVRTVVDGYGHRDYVAFRSRLAADRFASGEGTKPIDWKTVRALESVVSLVN